MAASLYSSKLSKSKYRNWVKAALGVLITKEGITPFVCDEIEQFQQKCLSDICKNNGLPEGTTCSGCCTENVVFCPTKGICYVRQGECSFHRDSATRYIPSGCPGQICHNFKYEIQKAHRYSGPSYLNTDATLWCSNPWEVAKCFMPPGGYKDAVSAAETDFNGINSVIINFKDFQSKVHADLSKTNNTFLQARDVVNVIRHSPKLEVEDTDLQHYFTVLQNLLSDLKNLATNRDAQNAKKKLSQLLNDTLVIGIDDVRNVLDDAAKDVQDKIRTEKEEYEKEAEKRNLELIKITNDSIQKIEERGQLSMSELDKAIISSVDKLETKTQESVRLLQAETDKQLKVIVERIKLESDATMKQMTSKADEALHTISEKMTTDNEEKYKERKYDNVTDVKKIPLPPPLLQATYPRQLLQKASFLPESLVNRYRELEYYIPLDQITERSTTFEYSIYHRTVVNETNRRLKDELLSSQCVFVIGETQNELNKCILNILTVWGDNIRMNQVKNVDSTLNKSFLSTYDYIFHIKLEQIISSDLQSFIQDKIYHQYKAVLTELCSRKQVLVILEDCQDINLTKVRQYEALLPYKLLTFTTQSNLSEKCQFPCRRISSLSGEVSCLRIRQRCKYTQNNVDAFNLLGESIRTIMNKRSSLNVTSPKIFHIELKNLRSKNIVTVDLLRLSDLENCVVNALFIIDCDSTVHVQHSAQRLNFISNRSNGYPIDNAMVSNLVWCFKHSINLVSVSFSKIFIGHHGKSITLSKTDIDKFRLSASVETEYLKVFTDALEFQKKDFDTEDKRENHLGRRLILHCTCQDIVSFDSNIAEAYAATNGKNEVVLLCLTFNVVTHNSTLFRGFYTEMRPFYPSPKPYLLLENSVNGNQKKERDYMFSDINETITHHADDLLKHHSNLEAIKLSMVHSKENMGKGPFIVLYCRCKTFVPYEENPFPSRLKHPDKENISFLVDVREGYYIPCPNNSVMTDFAKVWNLELGMGCSIGPENDGYSATLGPFVTVQETDETCFLTVRHLFQPLTKLDRDIIGTKIVQPADGDCSASQVNQQGATGGALVLTKATHVCERKCGEVLASEMNDTIDAALVKIDNSRLPSRGKYVNVTKDDLTFAGFSAENYPTYDDGSIIDARGLAIQDLATERVIKFGKETGLRKGTLSLNCMVVKQVMFNGSVQYNGRLYRHTLKEQLQVDSYARRTFFQEGDSGSAVFIVDKENKLHCIGMAVGIMSDLTCVVTPIQNILNRLGSKIGKTIEMKKFHFEEMEST